MQNVHATYEAAALPRPAPVLPRRARLRPSTVAVLAVGGALAAIAAPLFAVVAVAALLLASRLVGRSVRRLLFRSSDHRLQERAAALREALFTLALPVYYDLEAELLERRLLAAGRRSTLAPLAAAWRQHRDLAALLRRMRRSGIAEERAAAAVRLIEQRAALLRRHAFAPEASRLLADWRRWHQALVVLVLAVAATGLAALLVPALATR